MPNGAEQRRLPLAKPDGRVLDLSALETWLWDAACQIRGPLDAPKFKDYILPLIFLNRVGGGLAAPVPPHHRTYGSVSRRLERAMMFKLAVER